MIYINENYYKIKIIPQGENLKHTFDKDGYNIPMGQTNNLMDYSTKPDPIKLKKDQWFTQWNNLKIKILYFFDNI